MNRGDCFWVSPPTPEYYCYIWEPGTNHLISNLSSSICDGKMLPLPRCWHSPESLMTFASKAQMSEITIAADMKSNLFICRKATGFVERKPDFKLTGSMFLRELCTAQLLLIIQIAPQRSCYAVTTAYVCMCIFMNEMSRVKINLMRVFMGRSPANCMLKPTSKSLQAIGMDM